MTTLNTFLLDRTGSMGAIKAGTIEAYNAYVSKLAESGEDILFTLVQFDDVSIDKVHFEKNPKDVPLMTNESFHPRGMTNLIDAAFTTIKAVETALTRKPADTKVIICIQTDGIENCSHKHTWSDLKELIASKQAEGWQFNFMGAGIDAYAQAAQMGLSAQSTVSYSNDVRATRAAFAATAMNAADYSAGISLSTAYSTVQKAMAGDAFDPDQKKGKKVDQDLSL